MRRHDGGVAYNIVSFCARIPKRDGAEDRKRKSEMEGNRPLEAQFADKRGMSSTSEGRTTYTQVTEAVAWKELRVALPRGLAAPRIVRAINSFRSSPVRYIPRGNPTAIYIYVCRCVRVHLHLCELFNHENVRIKPKLCNSKNITI